GEVSTRHDDGLPGRQTIAQANPADLNPVQALDVPAECRIGGRIKPVNTDPCPHCNGTGRRPAE
ncbi:hypothetical protein ACWEU6_37130, partial [Streptosporangium sandarakinum]